MSHLLAHLSSRFKFTDFKALGVRDFLLRFERNKEYSLAKNAYQRGLAICSANDKERTDELIKKLLN